MSSFALLGQGENAIKYNNYYIGKKKTPAIYASFLLIIAGIIIVTGLSYLLLKTEALPIPYSPTITAAILSITALKTIQLYISEVIKGKKLPIKSALSNGTVSIAITIITIWLIYFSQNQEILTIYNVVLPYIFAIVISILIFVFCAKPIKPQLSEVTLKQLTGNSLYFWITSCMYLLYSKFDLWLVGYLEPPENVAIYAATIQLVFTITILLSVIQAILPTKIVEYHSQGKLKKLENEIQGMTTFAAIPGITILLVLITYSDIILTTLYTPEYVKYSSALTILCIGQIVNLCCGPCGLILNLCDHHRLTLLITSLSMILALTFSFPLYSLLSINGIALAFSIGQIFQNICITYHVKKKLNINPIVNIKILTTSSLIKKKVNNANNM